MAINLFKKTMCGYALCPNVVTSGDICDTETRYNRRRSNIKVVLYFCSERCRIARQNARD